LERLHQLSLPILNIYLLYVLYRHIPQTLLSQNARINDNALDNLASVLILIIQEVIIFNLLEIELRLVVVIVKIALQVIFELVIL